MAEFASLGISTALALITGLYAFFTYKILQANQRVAEEMSQQRKAMIRPFVTAGPEVDEYLVVSLVVKNVGISPATDLQLTMHNDFYSFAEDAEDHNIRGFSAFNEPISTFSAKAELRFDLAQGFNLGKKHEEKHLTLLQFRITARYKFLEDQYQEEFSIDLRPYMRSTVRRSKYVDEIVKARKALEKIADTT